MSLDSALLSGTLDLYESGAPTQKRPHSFDDRHIAKEKTDQTLIRSEGT